MWYWKENTEVPPENFGKNKQNKKKKTNDPDDPVIWMEDRVAVQQWRWQLRVLRMESAVPPPPAPFPPPPSLHSLFNHLYFNQVSLLKYDGDRGNTQTQA